MSKYYKLTDETFAGFYDLEIHSDLELTEDNGYYEITDEEWKALLGGTGEIKYIDGNLNNYVAETTTNDLKTSLASYKYTQQEGLTITTDNLTNLTASYNYLMLKDTIETYNEGTSVRWKNLDGSRVDITDDILAELESIRTQTRTHYQACFNAQEDIEAYIDTLTDSELQEVVISDLWEQYYGN